MVTNNPHDLSNQLSNHPHLEITSWLTVLELQEYKGKCLKKK